MTFHNCTEVTAACPVEATTYGYAPNYSGNAFLAVIFGLCCLSQLLLGAYYRAWTFGVALTLGCAMEFIGYIGRVQMSANPWSHTAFQQQIICLILAPSLLAAGVYLSFKHIVLFLGPELSRLPPVWYTWIFIGCDVTSIMIQALGGGFAASAQNNSNLLSIGNNIMVAGVAFQVVTMIVCGGFAADFAVRYYAATKMRAKQEKGNNAETSGMSESVRFRVFCVAEAICYITVLTRCIYRLPEMAAGWGSSLMRNENEFMVLDGCMIAIAAVTFTICHPGFFFPLMVGRQTQAQKPQEKHGSQLDESAAMEIV